MFGLGPQELIIILVIILVLFGGNKLPELARSLGKGVREFKHESEKIKEEYDSATDAIDVDTGSSSENKKPSSEEKEPGKESGSGESDQSEDKE